MTTETKHTPEPWHTENGRIFSHSLKALSTEVAVTINDDLIEVDDETAKANARRIVACVNACRDVPTEDLERAPSVTEAISDLADGAVEQRDALAAALRDLFENCTMVHTHWGEGSNQREADAAIANAHALLATL